MSGLTTLATIVGFLVLLLAAEVAFLAACRWLFAPAVDDDGFDTEPLPEFEADVRPERWSDRTERHIAGALAIGQTTDPVAIAADIAATRGRVVQMVARREGRL
jgi:hypothetical protein